MPGSYGDAQVVGLLAQAVQVVLSLRVLGLPRRLLGDALAAAMAGVGVAGGRRSSSGAASDGASPGRESGGGDE